MCYADDLGHCSEVQQLTSAVDRLVFYETARRLVIITRSLLMTQLQVSAPCESAKDKESHTFDSCAPYV